MPLSSFVTLIFIFFNLSIGFYLLFLNSRRRVVTSYLFFVFVSTLLMLFDLLSYSHINLAVSPLGHSLQHVLWFGVGLYFLNFATSFTTYKALDSRVIILLLISIFVLDKYFLHFVTDVLLSGFGIQLTSGYHYVVTWSVFFCLPVFIGLKRLTTTYYVQYTSDIEKKSILYIIIGTVSSFSCILFIDFLLVLLCDYVPVIQIGDIVIFFQNLLYFCIIRRYYIPKLSLNDVSMYLFQHTHTPIILINFLGNIFQINQAAKKQFNTSYADLLDKHISRVIVSKRYTYKQGMDRCVCNVLINEKLHKCFVSQVRIPTKINNGFMVILERVD